MGLRFIFRVHQVKMMELESVIGVRIKCRNANLTPMTLFKFAFGEY